ncbi:LacI family transcriptional regulator [Hypnocyclicus thermotrophus]|uniref:LacI family transcriptional regulator n=1 Tax=Hypnocyclicus thermotrophus TaxID=1627895 RepID=A0AA46E0I0_9FUSO|nr:LacI family DNA-binding transcriptional regulator [Hypnocyclicus thermotrophus]TDT72577.1 LacI family transcriptional regulator [Hypnocyclicus thermotrophus]
MSVTIKDIAKKLEISITAVSKALNDRPDISDELKEKVKKTAKKMGYTKNTIASRLVNQKSNTIGVFILSRYKIPNEENTGFSFLSGILEVSNKNNFDVIVFSTDSLEKKSYLELCRERRVEGAIFIGLEYNTKQLEELSQSKLPIVLIDYKYDSPNISTIVSDSDTGIEKSFNYLKKLNHKKIGFINGHNKAYVSYQRLESFKKISKKYNLYNENYIFKSDFSIEKGYELSNMLLNLDDMPTAFIVSGAMTTYGLVKGFLDKNINIPKDISIISYDNFKLDAYFTPEITSISQNIDIIGKKSGEALFNLINNGKKEEIVLNTELIIRKSCEVVRNG